MLISGQVRLSQCQPRRVKNGQVPLAKASFRENNPSNLFSIILDSVFHRKVHFIQTIFSKQICQNCCQIGLNRFKLVACIISKIKGNGERHVLLIFRGGGMREYKLNNNPSSFPSTYSSYSLLLNYSPSPILQCVDFPPLDLFANKLKRHLSAIDCIISSCRHV